MGTQVPELSVVGAILFSTYKYGAVTTDPQLTHN
jgi:hypothetical protein